MYSSSSFPADGAAAGAGLDAKGAGEEGAEDVFSDALGFEGDPDDVEDSGGRKGAEGGANAGKVPAFAAAPDDAAGATGALVLPHPAPAAPCRPAGVEPLGWSACFWLLLEGSIGSSRATPFPPAGAGVAGVAGAATGAATGAGAGAAETTLLPPLRMATNTIS